MNKKNVIRARILALLLTAAMVFSVPAAALEVFADTEEPVAAEQVLTEEAEESVESSETDVTIPESVDLEEILTENETLLQEEVAEGEAEEEPAPETEEQQEPAEEPAEEEEEIEPVDMTASVSFNADGVMTIEWEPVENAEYYVVTKDAYNAYKTITEGQEFTEEKDAAGNRIREFRSEEAEYTFENLFPGRKYVFTVSAYNEKGTLVGQTPDKVTEQPKLTAGTRKTRYTRNVSATRLNMANGQPDLRTYAGQKPGGYAVSQGGCTDGRYAYILLVSSSTQHGRVAVIDLKNNSLVKVSATLNTWHGNGMTYDSRRKQLVVIARDEADKGVYRKQEITCIDADPESPTFLTIIPGRQRNLGYSYFANDTTYFDADQRSKGLGSIAYSAKYDVYIANQRNYHNFIIIDPESLQAIGLVNTTIIAKFPGAFQAMDADDQYAYLLLSACSSRNSNIFIALDWNSNMMVDSDGHRKEYVPGAWYCINGTVNGAASPVAVYTVNTKYEAENIFHTTDANGNTHFYLTEYFANQQYKYVSKQKKYKVKWKKVKKKVRVKVKKKKKVKWKKVHGKWKYKKKTVYKYKWKTKKVWKYKWKTKTIKVKTPDYKDRKDYIYDLGVI